MEEKRTQQLLLLKEFDGDGGGGDGGGDGDIFDDKYIKTNINAR